MRGAETGVEQEAAEPAGKQAGVGESEPVEDGCDSVAFAHAEVEVF